MGSIYPKRGGLASFLLIYLFYFLLDTYKRLFFDDYYNVFLGVYCKGFLLLFLKELYLDYLYNYI